MTNIQENLDTIKTEIFNTVQSCDRRHDAVQLIAVSKKKSAETIMKAIKAGAKDFGENYIQEAVEKIDIIADDSITWHFIGHLQSNKTKFAVKYFEYIHTVDKFKLAKEINKQAFKHDRIIHCLLQVKIAREETKFGMSTEEVENLLSNPELQTLKNVYISGFMGMASFTDNTDIISSEFQSLKTAFDGFQNQHIFNWKTDETCFYKTRCNLAVCTIFKKRF